MFRNFGMKISKLVNLSFFSSFQFAKFSFQMNKLNEIKNVLHNSFHWNESSIWLLSILNEKYKHGTFLQLRNYSCCFKDLPVIKVMMPLIQNLKRKKTEFDFETCLKSVKCFLF